MAAASAAAAATAAAVTAEAAAAGCTGGCNCARHRWRAAGGRAARARRGHCRGGSSWRTSGWPACVDRAAAVGSRGADRENDGDAQAVVLPVRRRGRADIPDKSVVRSAAP